MISFLTVFPSDGIPAIANGTEFVVRCNTSRPTWIDTIADTLEHVNWPAERFELDAPDTHTIWIRTAVWPSVAHMQLFLSVVLRACPTIARIHFPLLGHWDMWTSWMTRKHALRPTAQWSVCIPGSTSLGTIYAINDWACEQQVPMQVLVTKGEHFLLMAPTNIHVRAADGDTRFECSLSESATIVTCKHRRNDDSLVYGYEDGTMLASTKTGYAKFGDGSARLAFVYYPSETWVWSGDAAGRVIAWKWTGKTFVAWSTTTMPPPITNLRVLHSLKQGLIVRNGDVDMFVFRDPAIAPITWTCGRIHILPNMVHIVGSDQPEMVVIDNSVFVKSESL